MCSRAPAVYVQLGVLRPRSRVRVLLFRQWQLVEAVVVRRADVVPCVVSARSWRRPSCDALPRRARSRAPKLLPLLARVAAEAARRPSCCLAGQCLAFPPCPRWSPPAVPPCNRRAGARANAAPAVEDLPSHIVVASSAKVCSPTAGDPPFAAPETGRRNCFATCAPRADPAAGNRGPWGLARVGTFPGMPWPDEDRHLEGARCRRKVRCDGRLHQCRDACRVGEPLDV